MAQGMEGNLVRIQEYVEALQAQPVGDDGAQIGSPQITKLSNIINTFSEQLKERVTKDKAELLDPNMLNDDSLPHNILMSAGGRRVAKHKAAKATDGPPLTSNSSFADYESSGYD